jgi:uncharacterized protein YjbI with pentapeptide repeats
LSISPEKNRSPSGLSETLPLILCLSRCTELFQKSNTSPIYPSVLSRSLFQKSNRIPIDTVCNKELKTVNSFEEKSIKLDDKVPSQILSQPVKDRRLNGYDLSNAYLRDANFKGNDLSYTNLSSSNLSYGNFSEANLSNADLSGVNLSGANLRDANLSYANLSDADLSATNLRDANLRDAVIDEQRKEDN